MIIMAGVIFILAFIFLFTVVVPLTVTAVNGGSQIRDGMRGLASRYRGFFKPGGLWRAPSLMFRYAGGARVQIQYLKTSARGGRPYFQMLVDWPEGPECWVADLEHAGRVTERGRRLSPIATNRDMQQEFIVRGDPASTPSLLSDAVLWRLNQLRGFGPQHDVEMSVENGVFSVRVDGPFRQREDVGQFVELALSLYDQVKLSQCRGIAFVEDQSNVVHEAKCGVCKAEILTDMVFCRKCKTPHHADCWQYFGKCTVFGCGEEHCITPRIANPSADR